MKRKKVLIVIVSILVVVALGLSAVPFLIDSNELKNLIIAQLESKLQRKVTAKEVGITVLTGPGIELKDLAIADDPHFSKNPFVMAESFVVRAGILSLLRGRLEISELRITHPVVELVQNREGVWNFASLMQSPETGNRPARSPYTATTPMEPEAVDESSHAPGSQTLSIDISSLELKEGTLSVIRDLSAGGRQLSRWENISLELSGISGTPASRFELSLGISGNPKNKLRLMGTFGPLNLREIAKSVLDARLECTEAPVPELQTLFQLEPKSQWYGTLSTSTRIHGSLSEGYSVEGSTHFSDLGTKRETIESARVKGDIQHKFSYHFASNTLEIDQIQLQAPNSTVSLAGNVQIQDGGSVLDLALKSTKTSFNDLLTLASVIGQGPPNGVQAAGYGQTDLEIKGTPKTLTLAGEARFADLSIRYPGLNEKIGFSPVTLSFKNSEMQSNPFLVTVGDRTRLQLQVASGFGADTFLNVKVSSQDPVPVNDLSAIGRSLGFVLPEGTSLQNGTISLQLVMRKRFFPNAELNLEGQSAFSETELRVSSLKAPLQIRGALAKFSGNMATISNLSATLSDISLNGNLRITQFNAPALSFTLKLNQLNIPKLLDLISSDAVENPRHLKISTSSLWGYPLRSSTSLVYASSREGSSAPRPLLQDFSIQDSAIAIDKVIYEKISLTNFSSKVRMQRRVLYLSDLQFKMNQGDHAGTATVDFSGLQPKYLYNAKLRNLDANEFLTQSTSLKNMIYGKLSCDMELQGSGTNYDQITKNLVGAGKVNIGKGKITNFNMSEQIATLGKVTGMNLNQSGTEFEDLGSDFTVRASRIFASNMRVKMTTMRLLGNGSFGFDQTSDCRILAELAGGTDRKGSDSIQLANLAAGVFFKNAQGNIVIPLQMTGVITNPKFTLDSQAVTDSWKNMMREGGVKGAMDSIQGLFKPKKSKTPALTPDAGGGKEASSDQTLTPEKPRGEKSSPWEDLLKGVLDQTKQKKKNEEKK